MNDFGSVPGIVRRAVGLGRYAQNRLAMVSNLFGAKREILLMKLHGAQDLVGNDERYDALERCMMTVTYQVRNQDQTVPMPMFFVYNAAAAMHDDCHVSGPCPAPDCALIRCLGCRC